MIKNYYLEYGSNFSKEEIRSFLDTKWDIVCTENDSSYFGVYFRYRGRNADKLSRYKFMKNVMNQLNVAEINHDEQIEREG